MFKTCLVTDMGTNEKIDEIIRKTAELLSSAGSSSEMTTRRIAENAGINPAMVNYYFGSKDGLMKAAVAAMGGDRPPDETHEAGGSRKAMFDYLTGMCETSMRYADLGLRKDAASLSCDAFEASSKLLGMKSMHDGRMPEREDAVLIFKTVCFLMTASADPEGFAVYSGIDIRIKNQLRSLVSGQLDIMLGDAL